MKTDVINKLPEIIIKDLDRNFCTCNDIPKVNIINAILNGATTIEEIKEQTFASDGIGCCTRRIEQLIESICSLENRT